MDRQSYARDAKMHLYNSALSEYQYTANSAIKLTTADFSAMKIGLGYKLNLMQSMTAAEFQHEGMTYLGYVYVDENGGETFFKVSKKQMCCDSNSQCYNLYEDVNNEDVLYDPQQLTLTQGSETYLFDAFGRTDSGSGRIWQSHGYYLYCQ